MKNNPYFSEFIMKQWLRDCRETLEHLRQQKIPFDRNQILDEDEVCRILGITVRTMRNYRRQKKMHFIKLGGRVYYLKFFLFLDFMRNSDPQSDVYL